MRTKVFRGLVLFFSVVLAVSGWITSDVCAAEKQFPSRFLEIVVPFPPGGPVDRTIRIISMEAEKNLGQKITILNKPGGGSVEGQRHAALAKPDGYTLLAMTSSVVSNILLKNVNYTIDSFDPLLMYSFDPVIFVVNAALPYKTLAEIIAAGKENPLLTSVPGKGNSKHIAGMLFSEKTGVKLNFIHTKGGTEAITMLAGGHVQFTFCSWSEVKAFVEQNKIRVIAVMAEERNPHIPDVPTFKEMNYEIYYGSWRGISVPKGLQSSVKQTLTDAFTKAVKSKTITDMFSKSGFPIYYKDSDGFRKYVEEDYALLKKMLKDLK